MEKPRQQTTTLLALRWLLSLGIIIGTTESQDGIQKDLKHGWYPFLETLPAGSIRISIQFLRSEKCIKKCLEKCFKNVSNPHYKMDFLMIRNEIKKTHEKMHKKMQPFGEDLLSCRGFSVSKLLILLERFFVENFKYRAISTLQPYTIMIG